MVSPYRFQTLPMPIVEMVVEYLEERARNSLHGAIDIHNQKKIVITPLLLVSERWRMAALTSICDNCSLIFNNSTKGYEVIYHTWPSNFSLPGFNRDRLVKRVVVLAPSWDQICSGAFSSIFTGPIYECAMFPTATSLMILLNEADSSRPIRNAHGRSSVPSLASTVRDTAVAGFACSAETGSPSS
ncbi:hypothetical protein FBU31_002254 [Coemansia sp. 'formosensis']|nr:hypothetical protein FBU31_002254 [Coemansia sp. 'formosensis']